MNLALTVLETIAPVFFLAGAGFVWVRLGFEYRIQFITRLAMTLAMPALIFTSLMKTEIAPEALSIVTLAAIVGYGVLTIAAWILVRLSRLDRRTYLAPMIFGNTGNLGLPLAYFAYSDQGLGYALVIFAVSVIYAFSVGVWMVSGQTTLRAALREPLIGATVLGAVFMWQGWETPAFLTRSLELAGQMAIPMMLMTLGVAVARLQPGRLGRAIWLSLVRVVLWIVLASMVGLWFDLNSVAFGVLVVQLSTPVAVTSYLLAEKYGADSDAVAGLVVVSTLLAILTLPITLAFLI